MNNICDSLINLWQGMGSIFVEQKCVAYNFIKALPLIIRLKSVYYLSCKTVLVICIYGGLDVGNAKKYWQVLLKGIVSIRPIHSLMKNNYTQRTFKNKRLNITEKN